MLSHVEDDATLDRYLDAIDKTSRSIRRWLARAFSPPSRMPRIPVSARDALGEAGLGIEVECLAKVGYRLEDYRKLIEEGQVDLLVMHAKEEDQLAMPHGPSCRRVALHTPAPPVNSLSKSWPPLPRMRCPRA